MNDYTDMQRAWRGEKLGEPMPDTREREPIIVTEEDKLRMQGVDLVNTLELVRAELGSTSNELLARIIDNALVKWATAK